MVVLTSGCAIFFASAGHGLQQSSWQMGLGVAKDRANELPQANDWMRYRRFGWNGERW